MGLPVPRPSQPALLNPICSKSQAGSEIYSSRQCCDIEFAKEWVALSPGLLKLIPIFILDKTKKKKKEKLHRDTCFCAKSLQSENQLDCPPLLLPHANSLTPVVFHNTVAAWLKQRNTRQVNKQPTESAVCDRSHANKAFSDSLHWGGTRRALSNCSLLITINL